MHISETIRDRYVNLFKQLMYVDQGNLTTETNIVAFRNNMAIMKRMNILNKNLGLNVSFHDIRRWMSK